MKHLRFLWLSIFLVLGTLSNVPARGADKIKDAESAAHDFEAASYQVVDSYQFPGVKVIQFELGVLSHYSYLLVSGKEAWVVDPGRDTSAYVEAAQKEGVAITAVWLSHSHADFVAGHMELSTRLKIPIYASEKTAPVYPAKLLKEGDRQPVGDAVLEFLETPGHTPDSMCALLYSRQNPQQPLAVLSGDTLFIGSVGRPDLLGEGMSAASLASMMFDTWTQKLSKLPDSVMVFPAHGAGSLCGAHLSDEPTSTLGEQRVSNPYLAHKNRGEFIAAVLEGLPEAPQYFQHNAKLNHDGPEVVDWEPKQLPWVEPSQDLADPAKHYVVDIRDASAYSAGHIPNSVAIGLRGRLETWVGIMVPWEAKLVLVGDEKEVREALLRLHRVGYHPQLLDINKWKAANLPLIASELISPQKLYAQMQTAESPQVLDVRLPSEWMGLRIGTVINIPLSELSRRAGKLDRTLPVVAVCNSAYRSTMAVGMLERAGMTKIASLAGGSEAWIEAGLPVFQAQAEGSASSVPQRQIRLADRMSAAELKRLQQDLPGTFQVADIRTKEQFADYSLPAAENVDIAELLSNPAYLTGAGPLIVVDRDGSLAMMVAGILSQKTARPIKALYGGLSAYWSETAFGGQMSVTAPKVAPQVTAPRGPAAAPTAPAGAVPGASPTKPKKKSAGC
jgi:glyoxylase-like metal-dependent hydrolase (beta-lactamase superfamily II)